MHSSGGGVAEPGAAPSPPHERGRTIIADSVLERLAARVALDVDGVVADGSDLEGLIGRRFPKAQATVAGQRARVSVDIAVAWPTPLTTVSRAVRDAVSGRVGELTGLSIDAVDVHVARVTTSSGSTGRRVQ